jgi:hypothetical protein
MVLPLLDAKSAGLLPSLFYNADCYRIENKRGMAAPLSPLDPTGCLGIGRCAQLTPGNTAKIIGDDVVVTNAAFVTMDPFEQLDKLKRLDIEAGFFADLADDPFDERLADFEHAARERPMAFEGLAAAANEQDSPLMNHDGPHADERGVGKFALHDSSTVQPAGNAAKPRW